MKILLPILPMILLAGCGLTPEGQAARLAVSEYSAKIEDAGLENLEWGICRGISVGAWARRYGLNPKKAEGWRALCSVEAVAP
mgnify:CR=1 FL=1